MLNKSKFIIVILLGVWASPLRSSSQLLRNPDNYLEIRTVLGSQSYNKQLNDVAWGADVNFSSEIVGDKYHWASLLSVERQGTEISYRNLNYLAGDQKSALGSMGEIVGLTKNIDFALLGINNFGIALRIGGGLAAVTKSYWTDSRNNYISSFVNGALKSNLFFEWILSPRIDGLATIGIYHVSNGGIFLPDKGLTLVETSLGFRFLFSKSKMPPPIVNPTTDMYSHSFDLSAGIGRRGIENSLKGIPKISGGFNYNYHLNDAFGWTLGLDAIYTTVLYDAQNSHNTYQSLGTTYDAYHYGISTGPELSFNIITIGGAYGRYVHFNGLYKIEDYWTLNAKYFFIPNLALQCKIYAHKDEVDFVSVGPLFRFGKIKKIKNRISGYDW